MRIGILGPLKVAANGHPVEVGGARLRALLILLALNADRTVSADRLIDDLWEDRPPGAAPNALQSLVSRLRPVIGREHLESKPGMYRLLVPPAAVDAHDFEARVAGALRTGDPAKRAAELREALALWRGPALEDVAGRPFAEGPSARLEGLRRTALDERIEADLTLGRHTSLIPELRALTAADPLSEPLRGKLMRALYAAGHQVEALAEYESAKRTLAETLGVDPSPDLENVYLAILRQDPTLLMTSRAIPGSTSAAQTASANGAHAIQQAAADAGETMHSEAAGARPVGNLRARITSFVGRDDDLSQLSELLAGQRLVTLTGPGGAGKTRLSLETGERWLGRVRDGVWVVEFAPITDPAEVPQAVLTALGLRETVWQAGAARVKREINDPLDRLAAALARKRLLLVLDNCEHLLDAAADLADRLLADCPGVRILATSREPLGITGEALWPVDPLPPPPPGVRAGHALNYPAVRLLADRAAAVSRGFAVTDGNVADIAQICWALDGMPLAIELAAARMRAMTPGQVAARLNDRFGLLASGSRTALPRHQTLRAVVEWSWDLLDPAERALWRRLAVFTGGVTAASAEEVCAGPELPRDQVFDVLTALVDKSLVTISDGQGEPRYRMLETIRAYGLERLAESGEEEEIRRAYATYFVQLAETAEPHLYRDEQVYWIARLAAEHDNLHAALRWSISVGDAPLAVRFCAGLGWYWFLRGQLKESTDTIMWVLNLPGLPEDQTTAVAMAIGAMMMVDGDYKNEQSVALLMRVRRICDAHADEELQPTLRVTNVALKMYLMDWDEDAVTLIDPLLHDSNPWVRGVGHFIRGQFALNYGHHDAGADDFARALEAFRLIGDRWGLAFTLTAQAELAGRRGDHGEAVTLYEESIRLNDALGGGPVPILHSHVKLANELALLGERDRAVKMLNVALREAERVCSIESMAALHCQLGEIARHDGDVTGATRHLDRAYELVSADTGPPHIRAMVLCSQGHLALGLGEVEAGRTRLIKALQAAVHAVDHPIIAFVLVGHAALALREGDAERSAYWLGAADGLRGSRDQSLRDVLLVEAATRKVLGETAFTTAYERGLAVTLDDVLSTFALERPPPLVT
ncbi:BTAD domain-containing putative transcriptional regulator [Actinomadura rudentiformis]|uniref:AfsR family transcriptional regulator n=1 Tax=Actinomadura rudentiformis TaxID=359158 RepID=A0A6H9Z0R3_9ACTN|nr:BTAD domain-containing putative transcriptional regulator [Actinomadura rudentiformis]KAB2346576.1 AfsR family transcriptional regulator [Actinomadura rudentiformis]